MTNGLRSQCKAWPLLQGEEEVVEGEVVEGGLGGVWCVVLKF